MKYGQFCPIAKATEILGEKWTIIILREILMGGCRFNTLQRGLGGISPALLTSRLKSLEEQGMVVRRKVSGQKGYEYYPTEACQALLPVLISMGEWGLIWARHNVLDEDFDVDFLIFYLERSVDPKAKLAQIVFAYRIRKYIGAYLAVLGPIDALVFTGGIGENSASMRAQILQDLDHLGIVPDPEQNRQLDREGDISTADTPIRILVIPTDEERLIARETRSIVQEMQP